MYGCVLPGLDISCCLLTCPMGQMGNNTFHQASASKHSLHIESLDTHSFCQKSHLKLFAVRQWNLINNAFGSEIMQLLSSISWLAHGSWCLSEKLLHILSLALQQRSWNGWIHLLSWSTNAHSSVPCSTHGYSLPSWLSNSNIMLPDSWMFPWAVDQGLLSSPDNWPMTVVFVDCFLIPPVPC